MGGIVAQKGTTRVVRRVNIDAKKLDDIANALGVPPADLAGAEYIEIHVGSPSSSGGGTTGGGPTP
jgi:hypothetical protein